MRFVNVKLSLDELYLLEQMTDEGPRDNEEAREAMMEKLHAEIDRCTYHPDEEIKEIPK